MAHRLVVIVAAVLAMACCAGSASAKVGPGAAVAAPTPITPPKAATFVAPNILPRLLVTTLPTR